jgi:micrococcal nuclease
LLAYLWLDDGRMVNEVMAAAGYVVELYYPPNDLYRDRIEAAVEAARIARRGLWATTAFDCLPVDFRAARCGSD